jgi:hypothetical protein
MISRAHPVNRTRACVVAVVLVTSTAAHVQAQGCRDTTGRVRLEDAAVDRARA